MKQVSDLGRLPGSGGEDESVSQITAPGLFNVSTKYRDDTCEDRASRIPGSFVQAAAPNRPASGAPPLPHPNSSELARCLLREPAKVPQGAIRVPSHGPLEASLTPTVPTAETPVTPNYWPCAAVVVTQHSRP